MCHGEWKIMGLFQVWNLRALSDEDEVCRR